MRVWVRRSLIGLAALVVVLAAAYYWLIVESHVPATLSYDIDLAEVRRLANELPGDKPGAVEVEEVGGFEFYATAIVAGDGWSQLALPVYSYQLTTPQGPIIVDTALDLEVGKKSMLASFDADAYARMQAAMAKASQIVITHEHMDHIGGLAVHPGLASIKPAIKLTREQIADPSRSLPAKFPENFFDDYQPVEYERYLAIAPGVVLIRAPGHTPGSQIVYVQVADGRELLLIGDVAWHWRNIELQRERARLMTWLFLKEDRHAVFGELAALKRLHDQYPQLHIVPGHDGGVIKDLLAKGVLKAQFSPAAPTS